MTYISRDIFFHISGINSINVVWKKMKTLFDKIYKSKIMQIKKELISMDPLSSERIQDYLL